MTLKEFWDSDEELAIHCDTEEKANKLLKKFDEMGKRWYSGGRYLECTTYYIFRNQTCYDNKENCCGLAYYINEDIKIIEFDDIEDFKYNTDQVNHPSHYTDGKIEVIDLLIDLTFDKHCKMKEVQYQVDKLVCDDLIKLKEELKKNIKGVINGK